MLTQLDLVIRGGTLVDGSGAPGYRADVGIHNGRIVAVGEVPQAARETLDASDKLVTPGFVDIHTHYDGQAIWDSRILPSAWHGVTTVVMGNCGVGFAPIKEQHRDKLIELMEGVEDIPGPCLHEGLRWNWETFAQYLDALEALPRDIDICAQIPHGPLRVYVMGERALRLEAATPDDIAQMREITRDAIRAGAFGFSTSRTIGHKTATGEPTPMLRASAEELMGIMQGMADVGRGQLEYVSDWNQPSPEGEFEMLQELVRKTGRSCVFSLNQRHGAQHQMWRQLLALSNRAAQEGLGIRPVSAVRAIGALFGLSGTQNPFSATPTYRSIAHLPVAARVQKMREPAIRARILSEDPYKGSTFALFERMGFDAMFEYMFPLGSPANYEPARETSVAAVARRQKRSAMEVAYDMLLEKNGQEFLYAVFANYHDYQLSATEELLNHPNVLMGLGDGGAHVGFITDSCFPTFLLTHWGRDRARGKQPIEELIRRYTSDPAGAVGLTDRGLVAPGMKADLNVIDLQSLQLNDPYTVNDLPAGGTRLMQGARGYTATIVSGEIVYRDGSATGRLPGKLVRSSQAGLFSASFGKTPAASE